MRRAVLALLLLPVAARAQSFWWDGFRLFRVTRDGKRVVIGLTVAELDALGTGPETERIMRAVEESGALDVWLYDTGPHDRAYRSAGRVTLRRGEVSGVEPYVPARVVHPPGVAAP